MRHVQGSQVHQLKGPELEAHLVLEYAVYGGKVGHAFAHQSQRFGAVTAPGMVDDKTRRVLRLHWRMAQLPGVAHQGLAHARLGLEAGDDLDHLHQGHRVKEVKARQPLWAFEPRTHGGDGQG